MMVIDDIYKLIIYFFLFIIIGKGLRVKYRF